MGSSVNAGRKKKKKKERSACKRVNPEIAQGFLTIFHLSAGLPLLHFKVGIVPLLLLGPLPRGWLLLTGLGLALASGGGLRRLVA